MRQYSPHNSERWQSVLQLTPGFDAGAEWVVVSHVAVFFFEPEHRQNMPFVVLVTRPLTVLALFWPVCPEQTTPAPSRRQTAV